MGAMRPVNPSELVTPLGKILALPPFAEADYVAMIRRTAEALPGEIQRNFIRIGEKNSLRPSTMGGEQDFARNASPRLSSRLPGRSSPGKINFAAEG